MRHGRYKYCKYCETDTMNNPELFTWFEYYTQVITKKYGPYYSIKCIKCGVNGAYYRTEKGKKQRSETKKKYRARKENKIKQAEHHRKWLKKNKATRNAYLRQYEKQRKKVDIGFKLSKILRTRIWSALKSNIKSNKTIELTGCNLEQLKKYLESKFEDGMNWDNYGVWHIDHIIPCARFDLSDSGQQKICFHYTNLQPMWGENNLKKGARLNG